MVHPVRYHGAGPASFCVVQPARIWIESAVPASSEAPLTAATSATITATPRPAPPPDQPTRMADRYVQNSVCRKSVCMAALPIPAATFRLALANNGITTTETAAIMMPGMPH